MINCRIPLFGMLVDVANPQSARLIGNASIDLSCFAKDIILPSRDTKRGFREGLFSFYDLMVRMLC